LAWRSEHDAQGRCAGQRRGRMCLALPGAQWTARRLDDLERAQDALAVARADPCRSLRIARLENCVQRLGALAIHAFAQVPADVGGYFRDFGEPVFKRVEVEPGATCDHRRAALGAGPRDFAPDIVQPLTD